MAFAFVSSNSGSTGGATSLSYSRPAGLSGGELLVSVWAFEGVAAGSGPWIIPNTGQFGSSFIGPSTGWLQACWQAPSVTGVGIEVWVAMNGAGSTTQAATFAASQAAVSVICAYTGQYNPTGTIIGAPPRVASTAQVKGNAPAAPAVTANSGELIVACGGDEMTASKFGTPSGFTNRVDVNRGSAGQVEATIADATATVAGGTGPITFPNAAASSTTAGATATLLIAPAPSVTSSLPVIDVGMPEGSVIGPGWTLRVTALSATTGAPVSGVTVSNVIFTDARGVEVTPPDPVPPLLVNEGPPS